MSQAFQTGYNRGSRNDNRSRTYEDKILVFKDGMKHQWLQNYLSDGKKTRFRILPSITDGEEDIALNPEGDEDTSMYELFGPVAATLEIATGIGERRYTFVTGNYADKSGTVVDDGWSVTRALMNRLRFKLRDVQLCEEHGRKDLVDIPPSWRKWMSENFRKFRLHEPTTYVCFQVVASEVNGEVCVDGKGKPTWGGPYLFAVRRSAMDQFLEDVRTKADPTAELSLENNIFGDFCSLDGGTTLMLRKIRKEGSDGPNTAYNLKPIGGPVPLTPDYVGATFVPWENLLYSPCIEEAIGLFAETFDGIAVDFALRDSPSYADYIPQDYRGSSADISDPLPKQQRLATFSAGDDYGAGDDEGDTPTLPSVPANSDLAPSAPPAAAPPAKAKKQFRAGPRVSGTDVNMETAEEEQDFETALAEANAARQAKTGK